MLPLWSYIYDSIFMQTNTAIALECIRLRTGDTNFSSESLKLSDIRLTVSQTPHLHIK